MSIELISLIVFVLILTGFILYNRKKIEVQKMLFPLFYFILYKTKIGLKLMDRLSKKEKLVRAFNFASVFVGFVGMAAICVLLVHNLYKLAFFPAAVSGVGLVLPVKLKGTFFVPFFYWIISILVIASVHEFCHGLIARYHNVRIKSSGFAFLAILFPIIPAAFVEPDEKQLAKKKPKAQMQVFAAGPFSNIVLGLIILLIYWSAGPAISMGVMSPNGANITYVYNDSVLVPLNVSAGTLITGIDSSRLDTLSNFTEIVERKSPGDKVIMQTDRGNYSVILGANPKNSSKPYFGVNIMQNFGLNRNFAAKYGEFIPNALLWIFGQFGLLYWLVLLNLGIGIFNLVPVGPIDGGRMLILALEKYFRKDRAKKIMGIISLTFLLIIILNILAGFLR